MIPNLVKLVQHVGASDDVYFTVYGHMCSQRVVNGIVVHFLRTSSRAYSRVQKSVY